jgi:hypothetical protein
MRIALGVSMGLASLALSSTVASAESLNLMAPAHHPAVVRATTAEAKLAPEFRVRADVLTTSASIDPFGDPDGTMRHRFASSMIDYYPLGDSGLRLSAGVRFFQVTNFLKDAEKLTGGLLYNPRLPGSGSAVRTGFGKHTPAVTIGYTSTVKSAMFGVEVGSLIGNVNANLPRSLQMMSNRARGGVNPVANLVFGLRF